MCKRYAGLGVENIRRCLAANGYDPAGWDSEAEYDESLWPGENIALVTARYGIRTTREWAAEIGRWREMAAEGVESACEAIYQEGGATIPE